MSRGGARKGAGRPRAVDGRVNVTLRVSPLTRGIMDEMKARGMNISREVDDMFLIFARDIGMIEDDGE